MEKLEFQLMPNIKIELTMIEGLNKIKSSPRPKESSKCQVKILSWKKQTTDLPSDYINENVQNLVVIIGEGNSVIDRGIELCLQIMEINQVVNFFLFHLNDEYEKKLLAECVIKLEHFSFEDNILLWPDNKKIEMANHHKNIGVELFKMKRNKDAFYKFSKAFKILKCIDYDYNIDDVKHKTNDIKNLIIILYNNMAQCHLIEKNYILVVELCSKILEYDHLNVKALYRRGNAYFELKQFSSSSEDFIKVLELEPFNNIAKEKLLISKQNEKVQNADFVAIVKKMFI